MTTGGNDPFFPAVLPFLLSLALDLEDLAMPGETGLRTVHWNLSVRLVDGGTFRPTTRRGRAVVARRMPPSLRDETLHARLRGFS